MVASTVPSCASCTFQPWTCSKQNRYSSTGQVFNIARENDRMNDRMMAAMLHGKEPKTGEKHAPSQTSRHGARGSAQSERGRRKPAPWQVRGSTRRNKEKAAAAAASQSEPAANRQRSNAPKLKDEAHIRSTMRIPTPQDYPNLPEDVFKIPRKAITKIAHGAQLAECRSDFVALAAHVYQCTAHYNSAMNNEAAVGEGRNEASRSIL